jgi:molecular chaperone Hsp33
MTATTPTDSDTLQRFLFDALGIRGQIVHLDATQQALLQSHPYPAPVASLLGQTAAASLLLSGIIKFDGSLTLQAQGAGPMQLVLVQASSRRTLRGMARWNGEVADGALSQQFGGGHLAVTIDPGADKDNYQGLVELNGDTLANALEDYFQRSEQLATRLWLVADGQRARGLLLQMLPGEASDPDGWNRICLLAATLTEQELLRLPTETLLRRLFQQEDLRLFEPEPVAFRCSCSHQRIATTLRSLGQAEVDDMIREQGELSIRCEFCNREYRVDAIDASKLFAEPANTLNGNKSQH